MMDTLANRLSSARSKLGLTQEELAKRAGVSQSTIGNLESGLRKSARKLAVIADTLGVDPLWLETGRKAGGEFDELIRKYTKLSEAQQLAVMTIIDSYGSEPTPPSTGRRQELVSTTQRSAKQRSHSS